MGGRGAKSSLSGIPKNKRKTISSLTKRINEHKEKIAKAIESGANQQTIHHWQKEIEGWEKDIDKIYKRRDRKK